MERKYHAFTLQFSPQMRRIMQRKTLLRRKPQRLQLWEWMLEPLQIPSTWTLKARNNFQASSIFFCFYEEYCFSSVFKITCQLVWGLLLLLFMWLLSLLVFHTSVASWPNFVSEQWYVFYRPKYWLRLLNPSLFWLDHRMVSLVLLDLTLSWLILFYYISIE